MLINIREFQIITYLGHQLYTFLDVCYIEGEFVDIVWHRDTVTDGTFHSAMTGTFQSDTGGTSIPLLSFLYICLPFNTSFWEVLKHTLFASQKKRDLCRFLLTNKDYVWDHMIFSGSKDGIMWKKWLYFVAKMIK